MLFQMEFFLKNNMGDEETGCADGTKFEDQDGKYADFVLGRACLLIKMHQI